LKCHCGEDAIKQIRDLQLCRRCYIKRATEDLKIQKEMVKYERRTEGYSNWSQDES
jgi:hypothetical protein